MELAIELFNTLQSLEAKGMHKQADQLANTMIRMAQEVGWGIRNLPPGFVGISQPAATPAANVTKFIDKYNKIKTLELELPERLTELEKFLSNEEINNYLQNRNINDSKKKIPSPLKDFKPIWDDLFLEFKDNPALFDELLKKPYIQKAISLSNVDISYDLSKYLINNIVKTTDPNEQAKALEQIARERPLLKPQLKTLTDSILKNSKFDKRLLETLPALKGISDAKPTVGSNAYIEALKKFQDAAKTLSGDELKAEEFLAKYRARAEMGDDAAKKVIQLYEKNKNPQLQKAIAERGDEIIGKAISKFGQPGVVEFEDATGAIQKITGGSSSGLAKSTQAADDAAAKMMSELGKKFPVLRKFVGPGLGILLEVPGVIDLWQSISENPNWAEDPIIKDKIIDRLIGIGGIVAGFVPVVGIPLAIALGGLGLYRTFVLGTKEKEVTNQAYSEINALIADMKTFFNENPDVKIIEVLNAFRSQNLYLESGNKSLKLPDSSLPWFGYNKLNTMPIRKQAWQKFLEQLPTIKKQAKQNVAQKIKDEQQKSIQQQQQMQQQMQMNKPMESSGYDYSASQQEYTLSSIDLELEHKRLVIAGIMNAIKNYEKEGNYKLADDTLNYTRKIFG